MTATLKKPGLFITGTDTGVGKTVVTCSIAAELRRSGKRVGVCKPYATGCRRDREGLVSEDAEALAHFADCRLPLHVINPVRFHAPLAPAVAAEKETPEGRESDIGESLVRLDEVSDVILIEGVGGVLVPLDEKRTVLDLMLQMGYPVVVVTRPGLGTLNHTAMTCRMIRDSGLRLAGLVVNRYHPEANDLVEETNLRWLAKQNSTPLLATIPDVIPFAPHKGEIPDAILDAVRVTRWRDICKPPRARL